ncbi:MAG: MIP/aquaporin family protein [Blastocatellia bacterium]
MEINLTKRAFAEFIGSAFLLASIIGSGIMGERLSDGNEGLTLLANSIAVGSALIALINAFGGVSGAHFNPAVTLVDAILGNFRWREVPVYMAAQIAGAFLGVALANLMFDFPSVFASEKVRTGGSQLLSEFIATFGLILVIHGTLRNNSKAVPYAAAFYIVAAFWFTSSTSFANPAVTLARAASNTFAGIRPADVPGFIIFQFIGAAVAAILIRWLFRNNEE